MNPMSTAERQDFADKTRAAMYKVGIDPKGNMVNNLIMDVIKIENLHRLLGFPNELSRKAKSISDRDRRVIDRAVEIAKVGFDRQFSGK